MFYESSIKGRAFSLVEVVVAVGVFAIAIVSVIGILAGVGRSVAEVSDADKAARLVGVLQSRLQTTSFEVISSSLKLPSEVSSLDNSYSPNNFFFATEDGSVVGPYNFPSGVPNLWSAAAGSGSSQADQDKLKYFELTLIRNLDLSPSLAADASAGFVAFNIRIRWPAYLPDGTRVTDNTQKEVLIVPAAVTR